MKRKEVPNSLQPELPLPPKTESSNSERQDIIDFNNEYFTNLYTNQPQPPDPFAEIIEEESPFCDINIDELDYPEDPPPDPSLLTKDELAAKLARKMESDWESNKSKTGRPPIGGAQE